jgi:hypothetical protein
MAVVSTTNSFSNNEQITSTKLNNIMINSAFVSGAVVPSRGLEVTASGQLQVPNSGITTALLENSSTTSNGVTAAKIANGAVITEKIFDSAITTIKLANSTSSTTGVTTAKIADSNVTTAKLADASITAPKLNGAQTGTAPIFGVRAWVNFNGQANTDIVGTYKRSVSPDPLSSTVTVTATAHGLIAGNSVYLDFPVGTGTLPFDGLYLVNSVTDVNTFTVISSTTTTSTGTATLKRKTIRGSGNVSNISAAYSGASPASPPAANQTIDNGYYVLNFATAMPDANFAISGSCNESGALAAGSGNDIINGFGYNEKCAFITTISIAGSAIDCLHNSVQVIR